MFCLLGVGDFSRIAMFNLLCEERDHQFNYLNRMEVYHLLKWYEVKSPPYPELGVGARDFD